MSTLINVLDHGYVKLVDSMGSDQSVIESARMSTGKGFLGWEPARRCVVCGTEQSDNDRTLRCFGAKNDAEHRWADTKGDASLLEFLYRNQHMTPFEMCELHVEVKAPIFVFREWHRHRTFSFNEFSARYAQMPNEHYVPELERFRPKVSSNKQESGVSVKDGGNVALWQEDVKNEQKVVYDNYDVMVSMGVPREVARINTPVARYSKMRAKTDLRNWLGFLKLRLDPAAQWEIRQYAQAVATIVKELWPRTYALFEEHTLGAVTLSATEKKALAKHLQSADGQVWEPCDKSVWQKVVGT